MNEKDESPKPMVDLIDFFFSSEYKQVIEGVKQRGLPEFVTFAASMFPEIMRPDSDRARVLVVIAMLDDALKELLTWKFKQTPEVEDQDCDQLLDFDKAQGNPAIGNFVTKARVAFVIGLIPKRVFRALKYAAEIRNKCAHKAKPLAITERISDKLWGYLRQQDVTQITAATENIKLWWTVHINEKVKQLVDIPAVKPSAKFVAAALALWVEIQEPIHQHLLSQFSSEAVSEAEANTSNLPSSDSSTQSERKSTDT